MKPGPFDRGRGLRRRWLLGWEGQLGRLGWSATPSALNLPRVNIYADGESGRWFVLSWGNGNSDPVWSLTWGPRR